MADKYLYDRCKDCHQYTHCKNDRCAQCNKLADEKLVQEMFLGNQDDAVQGLMDLLGMKR